MLSPPALIRWVAAWPGGAVIGIANGVARGAVYGRWVPDRAAHQISTATALAAFSGYYVALERRWPIPDRPTAVRIGAAWVGLTIAFEFGFGRAVAHMSWRELLADYNVARGRLWPVVLLWLGVGPEVVRRSSA